MESLEIKILEIISSIAVFGGNITLAIIGLTNLFKLSIKEMRTIQKLTIKQQEVLQCI